MLKQRAAITTMTAGYGLVLVGVAADGNISLSDMRALGICALICGLLCRIVSTFSPDTQRIYEAGRKAGRGEGYDDGYTDGRRVAKPVLLTFDRDVSERSEPCPPRR